MPSFAILFPIQRQATSKWECGYCLNCVKCDDQHVFLANTFTHTTHINFRFTFYELTEYNGDAITAILNTQLKPIRWFAGFSGESNKMYMCDLFVYDVLFKMLFYPKISFFHSKLMAQNRNRVFKLPTANKIAGSSL